jgi:hypothetical protein
MATAMATATVPSATDGQGGSNGAGDVMGLGEDMDMSLVQVGTHSLILLLQFGLT